jgi:hypothetical protein
MPVQMHPNCQDPDDWKAAIWRYMDFTKFVAILERRALYFATIAELQSADPFEGSSFPSPMLRGNSQLFNLDMARQTFQNLVRDIRVNCWHINRGESAALWRLYLKSNEGIAIQSTCERLRQSLGAAPHNVYLGCIAYIDYASGVFAGDSENLFRACLHKRQSFEHERELRALIWEPDRVNGPFVPVDLDVLMEQVYVAPEAPQWVVDLVEATCRRFSLTTSVLQSTLLDHPPY